MKKIILTLAMLAMPLAAAFAQDVIGTWKLDDGSAIVEVYKNGDAYNGKIVWLAEPNGPDGKPAVDVNNPDKALRSRKPIGLIMHNSLKKEGDVLHVRGSLDKRGLLGRTMDWFRVKE